VLPIVLLAKTQNLPYVPTSLLVKVEEKCH